MNLPANSKFARLAGRVWAAGWRFWPLALPAALLLVHGRDFYFSSPDAPFSDLTLSHYPNLIYLRRALTLWGTVPLWSPGILSGAPFAANPLSGLWYPPGWLALALPLPLGFNLLAAAHLVWGAAGMYALLRWQRLGHLAALFGGLAFGFMPKLAAHYGAGHLSLIYAVPWTPWLLLAQGRGRGLFRPGVVLAVIFMADVRWAVYAGVLWLAWAAARRETWRGAGLKGFFEGPIRELALAGLLSAPLALPLFEFTRLSTRAGLSPAEAFSFSLPPARLLGLVFPDFGGPHEWMVYFGGVGIELAVLTLVWGRARGRVRFWAWALAAALAFALGSSVPGLPVLARLPGLSLLRVPPRALFVAGMAAAALAAAAVDLFLQGCSAREVAAGRRVGLAWVGMVVALAGSVWALAGTLPREFAWGAAAAAVGGVWAAGNLRVRQTPAGMVWVLIGVCILDWGAVNLSVLHPRPGSAVYPQKAETVAFLAGQPGPFRVYSPSFSLPQLAAAQYGLEQAGGVDPLQLAAYDRFMARASGVPDAGYSITEPPVAGPLDRANAAYRPEPALLGLLNVRFVVADFDLPVEGLVLRRQFGATRVYENLRALPRAWVQPAGNPPGVGAQAAAVVWRPNRVEVWAGGPGLVVVSEIVYPGWRVTVDGRPAALQTVAGLLRGVEVGPGAHAVVFSFWPGSLGVGLLLGGLGVGWAAAGVIFRARSRRIITL